MTLVNDIRFGLRQLRTSPGFTLTVLVTLALCIGANSAIFSVVDAVLLRQIPYPDPDRLAVVVTAWKSGGKSGIEDSQTGATFEAVRAGASMLDVAAYSEGNGVNFASGTQVEYVSQMRVSTGYFRVLGVLPQIGREFSSMEDTAGGPLAAVVSYAFWQRALQGSPNALGQAIDLRGEPYTVVGILPAGFRTSAPVDVWTPLRPSRTGEGDGSNYGVVARLRAGATWAQANAQLQAISHARRDRPDFGKDTEVEERIIPFQTGMTAGVRTELLLTWGAVLVVLLIGCVNVAGLLLARSATRRREIATRMALGGTRAAVVRQLIVESVLLALGGGALGLLAGRFALDGLKLLGAGDRELWHPIDLDLRVVAATFACALLTSLLFGLAPALEATRLDIRSVLLEGGRGVSDGGRRWFRSGLVVAEIALSLVLLVGAGLLVRTVAYLNGLNPGFETRNIFTAQTSLQDARYATSESVNGLYTRGLERIRGIAGVEAAAVALTLPFERPLNDGFRLVEGKDNGSRMTEMVYVTPGYFDALRIPLRAGRAFGDADKADAAKVVVVSESFARKHFAGQDPIGRHLKMGAAREIVGVVGDVQQHSGLGDFGPLSIEPTVYMPVSQTSDEFLKVIHTWFAPKWVVRAHGQSAALAVEMQRAVASVDARLPVANFRTMDEVRSRITQTQRYQAALFSAVAGLALLLAAVGLYGLISYSVTQRTREMGIRMALGASARAAVAGLMRPGLALAGAGVVVGLGLSLGAAQLLRHLVWGVRPVDPATFVASVALLLAVAALATLLPALRIMRLDPAAALRA